MSTIRPIRVESVDDIRIVTMTRPDQMNAINAELHSSLTGVWAELAEDRDARAVVLTGEGRAFSAGGDLDWLTEVATNPDVRWRAIDEGGRLVREMLRCPLPVVAAVNGPAVGLGASIASLCDLVVMSERAFFADPHVQIGVAAGDGVVATWPGVIGMQLAKEYILLGGRIPATRALELGLANRVVDPDALLPTAIDLARQLGALPKYALRATKRAMNMIVEATGMRGLDYALASESEHFSLDEVRASLVAMRAYD